jgi:hypothetical protein
MIGKKINQLATELAPASTDLTIIGDPTTGVSKKITLAQLGAIFSGAVSFYTNLAAFPTPGTTDVIYCAKDTQKLYLWSGSAYVEVFPSQALLDTYQLRSEKGNANGYASLDSGGKVPISQLPSSIMEYKGTWNASTNTPTLANGTGDTGDVYICNVAGTVNFGAGAITFAVGDYVIYSGTIWQRSSGAVGTVTSVAASITGNAIGITGSPVTTSGTLAFAFAGNSTQYVNGAGNLVTFPGVINEAQNLITEVYNKTGATLTKGTVVYINGGQGNLPTITKALASADATSAQTYGIVRNDITNNNNGYVVVAGRISDLDTQAYTEGTQLYLSSTTAGTYTSTKQYAPNHLVYVGVVVRAHPTQGVIEVKIQNGYELDELHNVAAQTPTNNDGLFWEASTSLWKNKSLSTILGGTPVIGSGTTNFVSKFTASSTIGSSQIWDNGTSVLIGTTGSLPGIKVGIYSSTQRALEVVSTNASALFVQSPAAFIMSISNGTWITQFTNTGRLDLAGDLLVNTIANATTDTDRFLVSDSGVIKYRTGAELLSDIGGQPSGTYVTSVGLSSATSGVTIGSTPITTSGTITLAIATASGSQQGLLSSTDWTTFNNKQNALTNPVTGTGTINYIPKFTTTGSTIGNSAIFDDSGKIGIGTATPDASFKLTISGNSAAVSPGIYFLDEASSPTNYALYTNGSKNFVLRNQSTSNNIAVFTPSGNLGLGVTPSAWASGIKAIDVNAYASFFGDNDTTFISNNGFLNSSFSWIYKANNLATYYRQQSGQHIWYNAPSGTAGNAISFTQAMTLNASGNLSLGNTNDTYKLDVTGQIRVNGSTNEQLIVDYTTASGGFTWQSFRINGANKYRFFGNTDNSFALYSDTAATQVLTIASTGAATFSSSVTAGGGFISNGGSIGYGGGELGFGVTTSGATSAIYTLATNSPILYFDHRAEGNTGFWVWRNGSGAGSERMRLTAAGNLGLGSTVATSKLQISSTSSGAATVAAFLLNESTTTNTEVRLAFAANTNNDIATGRYSYISALNTSGSNGQALLFATNETGNSAVERMRITSGGVVQIGGSATPALTSKLFISRGDQYGLHINAVSGTVSMIASDDNMTLGTSGVERMRITSGGNLLLGLTSDFGYLLSVNGTAYIQGTLLVGGAATFSSSIQTGAPSGGTAKPWKLGAYQTNTVILDTAHYLQIEVDGVAYRLALAL